MSLSTTCSVGNIVGVTNSAFGDYRQSESYSCVGDDRYDYMHSLAVAGEGLHADGESRSQITATLPIISGYESRMEGI